MDITQTEIQRLWPGIDDQLRRLEDAHLVRRTSEQELSYTFTHALTQESAYESLLLKKQREIHRRVGQAYEKVFAERLDEYASLLAQHYAQAGDHAKTLEYATRAGDRAAHTYANAEAIIQYTRALNAAKNGPTVTSQWVYLFSRRGRTYELSGEYERALANYQEMESLANARGDRTLELESLMLPAIIRATPTKVFDPVQAQDLATRALALAQELDNSAAKARVLWILALLDWFTGRAPESAEYGEKSLALARRFDLREQTAFTLSNLSHPYMATGRTGRAIAAAMESIAIWRELDNQPMLCDSLGALAEHEFLLGDFDRAQQYSAQALQIGENIGSSWGQSFSQFLTGNVFWELGDPSRAIQIMETCIALGEQAGFAVPLFGIRAELSWVYAGLGALEKGLDLCILVQRNAQHLLMFGPWPFAIMARIQLLMGRTREAQETIQQARDLTQPEYLRTLYPIISIGLALAEIELALAQSKYPVAIGMAERLIDFLDPAGIWAYLPEARYLKAQGLKSLGERGKAKEELVAARAVAETIGSRRMLWPILAELCQMYGEEGDGEAARTLRNHAREIVEHIASRTPDELRASLLNLPRVRQVIDAAD